jgi:GT2 family glycosyltransferase
VLGFIACGAVARRNAYLAVGGFHPRFGIGGEEELLAVDLASAGWHVGYVDCVVAHHHPSPSRDPQRRRQIQARNALWFTWLRRSPRMVLHHALKAVREARHDHTTRRALLEAVQGLPWIVRERHRVPASVEAALCLLDR